jgi:hypothetical protein
MRSNQQHSDTFMLKKLTLVQPHLHTELLMCKKYIVNNTTKEPSANLRWATLQDWTLPKEINVI